MERQKRLIVISGFSGVGKGTVLECLADTEYVVVKSDTSRQPRNNSTDNYRFVTREQFLKGIDSGRYLEWTQYNEEFYGTSLEEVDNLWCAPKKIPVLEIETDGFLQIMQNRVLKQMNVNITSIYIVAAPKTVNDRLDKRGEVKDSKLKRLQRTLHESQFVHLYDHVIYNTGDIYAAQSELLGILSGTRLSVNQYDADQFCKEMESVLEALTKEE